jgi:hypothetical protein
MDILFTVIILMPIAASCIIDKMEGLNNEKQNDKP